MIVGFNGECVSEDRAAVSVFDHGFLYGIGLFETFRTYNGVPMLLEQHMDRLSEGSAELGIKFEPKLPEIRQHIRALLAANGLSDGYVRYSVSAGVQPLGLPAGDYEQPTVIVYVKALPHASTSSAADKALQLLRLRRNSPESAVRMKSFHYMNNVLAKRELSSYPWAAASEGLFLTEGQCVAEGIVSNICFIKQNKLFTPSLAAGILPGITRAHVLACCLAAGIPAEEGLYPLEMLLTADEIFLTGSVQELVPVNVITDTDGQVVWLSSGDRTWSTILQEAYRNSVLQEVGRFEKEDV